MAMAASSCSCATLLKTTNGSIVDLRRTTKTDWPQRLRINKSSNTSLVITKATPEAAAGDALSSLTALTGLSLPGGDTPWLAGIAGLLVTLPLIVQRLLSLTKEIDMTAQTVEKIADAVGKVADEVDKAAEDFAEALPEGGLKKVVSFVEDLAEETSRDAQKVEDLMDKVEELDDKLEEFLKKKSKGENTV